MADESCSAVTRRGLVSVLLGLVLLTGQACAGQRRSTADTAPGAFDYYLFNLSWAPDFCSTHSSSASSSECDPKRHYGFVVHGMWPENNDGSYPQNCAPAQPVSQAIVQQMLPIMPARGLIQHEWATHGTCSGLSAQDYFALIRKAFQTVQVPADYRTVSQTEQVSPGSLEQSFAQSNNTSTSNFRVSCSGSQFVGMEVCLTQDLQFRACGQRLKDCRAPQVSILPTP